MHTFSRSSRSAVSAGRFAPGHALCAAACALVFTFAALPIAQAQSQVDVEQARQALARGAMAWDLRPNGAVLPGAVRVAPQALTAWLERRDSEPLSQAVSQAGLNLSAEVLLVAGDDAQAQAVAEQLRPLVRGRLNWLAGGAAAWQAAGLPLQSAPSQHLPMPQRLVPAEPAQPLLKSGGVLADAARRGTLTWGPAPAEVAQAALSPPSN
jgi:3-mercaptopyruvate sulfurtransferase SseA